MKYNNYEEEEEENSNNSESSENKQNFKKKSKYRNENQARNNEFFLNNNSLTESDIDEFKSIFNQNDLKNNNGINMKSYDSSNLFDGSEDINYKKDEITLKDLDPKIKEVLILFVLSNDYYQLLVQERAKKSFKFNKKKK